MVGLSLNTTPGPGTWTADFTGTGIVILWGGGGGGAGGKDNVRGGDGGGSGAAAYDYIDFVSGQEYDYYIGAGGAGGPDLTAGSTGSDGEASYWGGGTTLKAAGGHGGSVSGTGGDGGYSEDCLGRARIPGGKGSVPPLAYLAGGKGGDAPNVGEQEGGDGGAQPGQNPGNTGTAPAGGGSGGGQRDAGGDGAPGGIIILQATDPTIPGDFWLGVTPSYVFDNAGQYDDFIPDADGEAWFEAVGGGGAGKSGHLTNAGGHGGGGGAYAATMRDVYSGVVYRRTVGAHGVGNSYGGGASGAGTPGGDSEWTLRPLRIWKTQVAGSVATVWTAHPTDTASNRTPQKHGLKVGDSVTISGSYTGSATFNGTYTVTAVSADRLSFSFAKGVANQGPTAFNSAGDVSLTLPFVRAKGGLAATGNGTGGTAVSGGSQVNSIGTIRVGGAPGNKPKTTSLAGGDGGGGALPLGDRGGWAGGTSLAAGNAGEPGLDPGGGGGGGRNSPGGNGGNGGRGAAVVRWIRSMGGIWVGGEKKDVTRIKVWTGGTSHVVQQASVWDGGVKRNTHKIKVNPESLMRRYPTYLPANYKDRFHRPTGTFNWKEGAPHVLPALLANNLDFGVAGDSVSEGWLGFDDLGLSGTADFQNSFPCEARDLLDSDPDVGSIVTVGGTGFVRANTIVAGAETRWNRGGWSRTVQNHYLQSSSSGDSATFSSVLPGTAVAVITSGGAAQIFIDGAGTPSATSAVTAAGTLTRTVISGLANTAHTVVVKPVGGTAVQLYGADVYTPGVGLKVHNWSQGGAKASGATTGQSFWGATGDGSPTNMTLTYKQMAATVGNGKSAADAVIIFLGGNDSKQDRDAATIKAAMSIIGDHFDGPNTDIILAPDVWTSDRNVALMDLCMEKGWAMIDIFYLTRELTAVFGLGYNGDSFGHLNNAGAIWMGGMVKDAFKYDPFD
jgi:hypothetical protein